MKGGLSADEICKIESGLCRPSEWSADLLISFPVHQLRNAKVAWLNKRWFLERGVDVADSATFTGVCDWLLTTFGYACQSSSDKSSAFTKKTKEAFADRYGSSGGTAPHGGSGRVAIDGCFQVKGIGITPLVGVNAPSDHANGCATLTAGIREAIYSEIVEAEFPHGAIPVVALLDTGLYVPHPEGSREPLQRIRRALVIRPCVLRPAHAERAALFERSVTGYVNSQEADVRRTRDVVRYWMRKGNNESVPEIPGLKTTLGRAAEQAAFGQVHRLFNGGYFSSNLAVTGQLLDFGNMHPLPDWASAKVLGHTTGFGGELDAIKLLASSMDFYFRKYGDSSYGESTTSLIEFANNSFGKTFAQECLNIWSAGDVVDEYAKDEIVRLVLAYFKDQQKKWRRYNAGKVIERRDGALENEWIHDAIVRVYAHGDIENGLDAEAVPDTKYIADIVDVLRRAFKDEESPDARLWVSISTALRLLKPRVHLYQDDLMKSIKDMVKTLNFTETRSQDSIGKFVARSIDQGRRHWPRLPSNLGVLSYKHQDGCSILLCSRGPNSPRLVWVEAPCTDERVCLFGTWVLVSELDNYEIKQHVSCCSFLVPEEELLEGVNYLLRLRSTEIQLPMTENYVLRANR